MTYPNPGIVVSAETIESAWGNGVQERVVKRATDTGVRDALFPSPSAGDVCYLTGSDEFQVYDGAVWQTYVTAAEIGDVFDTDTATATDPGYPGLGGFAWTAFKTGNMVTVRVDVLGNAGEDSTGRGIDLPVGWRPIQASHFAAATYLGSSQSSGLGAASIYVRTNGSMLLTIREGASTDEVRGTFSYAVT